MEHLCARPLLQLHTNDANGAIASDFWKAVMAMTRALTQVVVNTADHYPLIGLLVVLALLGIALSADQRRWSAERRRRNLTARIESEEHAVWALEVDAQRRRWSWRHRGDDQGRAGSGTPPESPP